MSASHPSLPPSGLLAGSGALGGDGGDDDPHRRHLPLTHAVDANPAFPDEEENPDPNPNDGNDHDPTSAAFAGAAQWRKRKQAGITPTLHCPVCRKEFANPKALHGHMRCHPDRTWRGITPPALRPESEKEVAASLVRLSGSEDAWVKRYRCSRCGRDFDTRQALGGHRASHRSVKGCHAKSKYEGRNGSGDHGVGNGRPGGHVGKGGIQKKIGQRRRRRGRWKTSAETTAKEMATDTVVQTTAAAAEEGAERRVLLLDLNLPAPPEDKNDDSSSGIIDLNKKLPGHDDE